jgi:hypothetical protein
MILTAYKGPLTSAVYKVYEEVIVMNPAVVQHKN